MRELDPHADQEEEMAERQEGGKAPEKSAEGGRDAAREKLPPAEGQEESLKVHGDKLEPRKG